MIHDCSGVGPSVPSLLAMNHNDVARHDCISMGMGTVDEQMAVRAQLALMCRFTRGWNVSSRGNRPVQVGSTPHLLCRQASRAFVCAHFRSAPNLVQAPLKKTLYSECTLFPSFGKAGARRTTVDKEDNEEDEQPPLEGEDLTGGVADCASAVMRERVEAVTPMKGRKGTRRVHACQE